MEAKDISTIEKHFTIWSERDAEKRAALMMEVYDNNIEVVDPHFIAHGHAELQVLIANLQAKFPERRFRLRKPVEGHHEVARLFWKFGTEEEPEQETGQDVFILENGKIKHMTVFIDVR